ncbi:MAG TPA: phage holin family protein [Verrucomicrobiae bacterium]|nr:phage holin family protein [Verrucomicrobiae bacterium]
MDQTPPPRAGLFQSIRYLGRSGIAVLQNRIELFAVELEEQKIRFIRILILAGAAIFLANTALLVISATIVYAVGEKARLAVLLALSAIYVASAIWAFVALQKELRSSAPAFKETVAELKKDTDLFREED